jgi:NADH-quinone oxidoreductase subunit N
MRFDLTVPSQLTLALLPDLVLAVGAMGLLLWAAWRPESEGHQRRVALGAIVVTVLAIAAVVAYMLAGVTAGPGVIAVDNFRWACDLIILAATLVAVALSLDYSRREGLAVAESHVLVLLATSGMMLLAAARDLVLVFLGIELMSIGVYVLAGLNRRSVRGAEAALKYFLLGAFSSAFLLYGIALVLMMLYRPEGLFPSRARRAELRVEAADEGEVVGSLGEVPGSEVAGDDAGRGI